MKTVDKEYVRMFQILKKSINITDHDGDKFHMEFFPSGDCVVSVNDEYCHLGPEAMRQLTNLLIKVSNIPPIPMKLTIPKNQTNMGD